MKADSWLARQLERPRPYPVDALAVALGIPAGDPKLTSKLALVLDLNRGWVLRCRALGLNEDQADKWATRAGIHPGDVWLRWFDGLRGAALTNANKAGCPRHERPFDRVIHGRRRCSRCLAEAHRRYRRRRQNSAKSQVAAVITINEIAARHLGRTVVVMDSQEPVRTDWLTVREVAEQLRVHRDTVLDAVARGDLPHVRVGRTIRIPRSALTIPQSAKEAM